MTQKVATMNISLPVSLRAELEKKLQRQFYSTASEYVRELIRKDLHREAIKQVDTLLLEGIHSGPAASMPGHNWQELRQLAGRRLSSTRYGTKKVGVAPRRTARPR